MHLFMVLVLLRSSGSCCLSLHYQFSFWDAVCRAGCESSWLMKLNFAKSAEWLVNPPLTSRGVLPLPSFRGGGGGTAVWSSVGVDSESALENRHVLLIGTYRVQDPDFPRIISRKCPTVLTQSYSQIILKLYSNLHISSYLLYLIWFWQFLS